MGDMSAAMAREVPVPPVVLAQARGRVVRPVWEHHLGGSTFQLGSGTDREFVKWVPPRRAAELAGEARRLEWADRFATVPRVLGHGGDASGGWLRTAGLPGENAVTSRWLARPREAVTAIGRGLRALHDTLPVAGCPFSWSVATRVAESEARGEVDPARARAVLEAAPPVDRMVVCHGDACAPNTLLTEDGSWSGRVDLGRLGVADRWADLGAALWSVGFNYGDEWRATLLEAYGVAPDAERAAYYQELYHLR